MTGFGDIIGIHLTDGRHLGMIDGDITISDGITTMDGITIMDGITTDGEAIGIITHHFMVIDGIIIIEEVM